MSFKVSPALFDISQDISSSFPLNLVSQWIHSKQTSLIAQKLLEKYKVHGILSISNTSGLSKLAQQRPLVEVLAMLHRIKQIVAANGSGIGGETKGIWATDNTQLYYGPNISVDQVISAMKKAQQRIVTENLPQIGIGIHKADYYEICEGFYGKQADSIEEVTEDMVDGGELVVTAQVTKEMKSKYDLKLRQDISIEENLKFYTVMEIGPMIKVPYGKEDYKAPYSNDFAQKLATTENIKLLEQEITKDQYIVLFERECIDTAPTDEQRILDNLAATLFLERLSTGTSKKFAGKHIKVVGNIGIYTFQDATNAILFAGEIAKNLREVDIRIKVGIDFGDVFLFKNKEKLDIFGSPVNIASKMAQDRGELDNLYITPSVYSKVNLSLQRLFSRQTIEVSRITIPLHKALLQDVERIKI